MTDDEKRPADPWLVWWWKNLSTVSRMLIVFAGVAVVVYIYGHTNGHSA